MGKSKWSSWAPRPLLSIRSLRWSNIRNSNSIIDISICACKQTSTVYISICACKQTSTIYISICACKQTSTILVYICASQQTNRTFSLVEFHDRRYGEIFTGHRVSSDTPRTSAYKEERERKKEKKKWWVGWEWSNAATSLNLEHYVQICLTSNDTIYFAGSARIWCVTAVGSLSVHFFLFFIFFL